MTGLIPTVYEAADPLRLAITAAYVKAMRSSLRKHRELLDKIQAVKDGKIEPPLYYVQRNRVEEWKQGFIKQLVRQSNLTVQIATDMAVAGAWARDEIQATIAEVYAYRRETFAEELGRMGIRVDFGHYNRSELMAIVNSKQTPFSKIAYRQLGKSAPTVARLNHELANWILLGKPQDDLRKRIQKVACYENIWQANRTAQTERTRIQSQAANDNLLDAERLGLRVAKQWSCKLHNSRDSHIALHGRVVMVGEDFIPGVLAFPGDPRAPAKEVCNCHCVLIERPLLDDEEVEGGRIVKRIGIEAGAAGLPETVTSGILSVPASEQLHQKIKSGYFPMKLRKIQDRHTYGETWRELVRKGQYKGVFARGTDVEELIRKYAGTASFESVKQDNQGTITEFITAQGVVGRAHNGTTGKYEATSRFAIRYSKKGMHAFPVIDWRN